MKGYSPNGHYSEELNDSPEDEARLAEQIQMLQRAFADIDVNHDEFISKEELLNYLDIKSGTTFSREIADELYEQMDQNDDGKITINEFIRVFIEAHDILYKKIQMSRNHQEGYRKKMEESLQKAEEARRTEQFNVHGITLNSMANVIVLETRSRDSINPLLLINTFVEVCLDGEQSARTEICKSATKLPSWDEQFNFEVKKPDSRLDFMFYKATPQGDDILSTSGYPLSGLLDQNVKDHWIDFNLEKEVVGTIELHVKLQWIHSKTKYFTMLAQKCEENYQREEEEILEYQKYLKQLNEPFLGMNIVLQIEQYHPQEPQTQEIQSEVQAHRQEKQFSFNEPYTVSTQRYEKTEVENRDLDVAGLPREKTPSSQLSKLDTVVESVMNLAARTLVNKTNPNEWFWKRLTLILCLVELLLVVFILFRRASFFDLCMVIMIILQVDHDAFKGMVNLKGLGLAVLGSIVTFDFIWLLLYTGVKLTIKDS